MRNHGVGFHDFAVHTSTIGSDLTHLYTAAEVEEHPNLDVTCYIQGSILVFVALKSVFLFPLDPCSVGRISVIVIYSTTFAPHIYGGIEMTRYLSLVLVQSFLVGFFEATSTLGCAAPRENTKSIPEQRMVFG